MNAIEKFALGDSVSITELKPGVIIFLHNVLFKCQRKFMRGLEQHLAHDENHNYIFGVYVYKLEDVDGNKLYIRFEPDWVYFGAEAAYSA